MRSNDGEDLGLTSGGGRDRDVLGVVFEEFEVDGGVDRSTISVRGPRGMVVGARIVRYLGGMRALIDIIGGHHPDVAA